VRFTLPIGARVSSVRLLRAGTDVKFARTGNTVEFTIPRVSDYEVAALV
jgi:hypothetical protein